VHCFLVGLTFYYSVYMIRGSGEHMVMKGSSGYGDEGAIKVMMESNRSW